MIGWLSSTEIVTSSVNESGINDIHRLDHLQALAHLRTTLTRTLFDLRRLQHTHHRHMHPFNGKLPVLHLTLTDHRVPAHLQVRADHYATQKTRRNERSRMNGRETGTRCTPSGPRRGTSAELTLRLQAQSFLEVRLRAPARLSGRRGS